jgi:non-specific serine/threonine protein kinase
MIIELLLTPAGHLRIEKSPNSDGWDIPAKLAEQLISGFSHADGSGLIMLLHDELPTGMPATFQYFRKFTKEFVTRLCHLPEPTTAELNPLFESMRPNLAYLGFEALEIPPMRGAEYFQATTLLALWQQLESYVQTQFNNYDGSFSDCVRQFNPAWQQVGKVSFHLAENKQDADGNHPFAFMATFIHRLSESDQPKHLPLAAALKAYANDRNALLTLLKPVQAAGQRSELIQKMVTDKTIYRPTAWSPLEAYKFLQDVAALEASGIIVRIAKLWKSSKPSKVKLSVNIDVKKGQKMGINALLDFSWKVSLDGVYLTKAELEEMFNADAGLVRIKGQWVEADPERIKQLLAQWDDANRMAGDGFSFVQGLKMLAGAQLPGQDGALPDIDRDFSSINAVGEMKKLLDELASPEQITLPKMSDSLQQTLRPYQLDGVKWLWRMTELGLGGCLADDMGLGKTLQILTMLSLLKQRGDTAKVPVLLIAPASLLKNWEQESAKFTPELRFGILHPMAMERSILTQPELLMGKFDALITTYGMVTRLKQLSKIVWTAIIIDEAQAIKNPQSQQSRAVRTLRSSRKLALTGTPVENRLTDLWTIFDYISPGLLGNINGFKEFIKKLTDDIGGVNYAPLRRLTKPYIMRRLKTDKSIISDLPDKTEIKVYCSLTKQQATLYQQAVRSMAKDLKELDDIQRRGLVFKYLMVFKQICNHPAQFDGSGDFNPAAGGKFQRITAIVEEISSRQEKVLIFTQFREMIEPLHEHLAGCFGRSGLMLHGGTSIKKRQQLVEQFQSESGPPFFVLSLKAAGTGLNLTAANHVIHFDRWWNPAVENQATDRAYRIGQHRNVLAHKFICKGTIEEKIDALIDDKRELSDSLIEGSTEKMLTDMNNNELLDFVALDVNSVIKN